MWKNKTTKSYFYATHHETIFISIIHYMYVTLEPRGFSTHGWAWGKEAGEEAKPNLRYPLGAHGRSFEHADPIRSCYSGFRVKIWPRNLNDGFWLDRWKGPTCASGLEVFILPCEVLILHLFVSEKTSGVHVPFRWSWMLTTISTICTGNKVFWFPFLVLLSGS